MLVYFACENFKVFRDEVVLDLRATPDKAHRDTHVVKPAGFARGALLKSCVLLGPNAAGKSSLFDALKTMQLMVLASAKWQIGDLLPHRPFRLDEQKRTAATSFELCFLSKSGRFRYGFRYDRTQVKEEWLWLRKPGKRTRERMLFERTAQDMRLAPEWKDRIGLLKREGLVRDNALLLSVAAQFNAPVATEIVHWFRNSLLLVSGLMERGGDTVMHTLDWANERPERKALLLELLRAADFGIVDFREKEMPEPDEWRRVPETFRMILKKELKAGKRIRFGVETAHRVEGASSVKALEYFDLHGDESAGTERFFALAGPVLHALEQGCVLFVDELDARLHFALSRMLVARFHDKAQKCSQLLFTTHNLLWLDTHHFRRDQLWLLEKDPNEAASLFSLAEYKSTDARKGINLRKRYLEGRFGAMPLTDDSWWESEWYSEPDCASTPE